MRAKAGDPPVMYPTACHACHENCLARFTCELCGRSLIICWWKVGGFEATPEICTVCAAGIDLKERRRLSRLVRLKLRENLKTAKGEL